MLTLPTERQTSEAAAPITSSGLEEVTFATLFGMSDGATGEPTNEKCWVFITAAFFVHVQLLPFKKKTIFSHLF